MLNQNEIDTLDFDNEDSEQEFLENLFDGDYLTEEEIEAGGS